MRDLHKGYGIRSMPTTLNKNFFIFNLRDVMRDLHKGYGIQSMPTTLKPNLQYSIAVQWVGGTYLI